MQYIKHKPQTPNLYMVDRRPAFFLDEDLRMIRVPAVDCISPALPIIRNIP